MAHYASRYGHRELVQWLCGEGGFAMDERVMERAASSGNLELVQWLWGEGCPWDRNTCYNSAYKGHVEVLRWARENGCLWDDQIRDMAAVKIGYTDAFGNVDYNSEDDDDDGNDSAYQDYLAQIWGTPEWDEHVNSLM